jgi:hypothetical protein
VRNGKVGGQQAQLQAAAVLIRSGGRMRGPGRLGIALALTRALSSKPAGPKSGLWLEKAPKPQEQVLGVAHAGPFGRGGSFALSSHLVARDHREAANE